MAASNRFSDEVYLVVEDEYFIATMLTMAVEDAGTRAIGPVSNVDGAGIAEERSRNDRCRHP
jgi:ribosomal 30S subunit maturation factor RimM